MHLVTQNGLFIAGSLVGFSVGLAITALLLIFTVRASRIPGTPRANLQCAICALVWNAGGLAHSVLSAFSSSEGNSVALFALAIQFTGAALWPIPMLLAWRPFAVGPWQKTGMRVLTTLALIGAALIIAALWAGLIFGASPGSAILVKELASFNASWLMMAAGFLVLRGRVLSRTTRIASLTILTGVLAATAGILIQQAFGCTGDLGAGLALMSEQSTLLIVLGAFFLFAHFRFADIFIRSSVRILWAGTLAVLLTLAVRSPRLHNLAPRLENEGAFSWYATSALAAIILLAFLYLDRRSGAFINRWIFRAPDYRLSARRLGEVLARLHSEAEIGAAVEDAVRATLDVQSARLLAGDAPPQWASSSPADCEPVEISASSPLREALGMPSLELLVPIRPSGQWKGALAISPGLARSGLVSQEVDFLKTVAAHLAARFDALRLEREVVEQRAREALLLQQVTEAELRALRAQVNPHFLFNSLNTIANLIVTNPSGAETMTLRLARIFRYVLTHSAQSLTSIHDEIEFLRTYLEIERARFGDRLRVEIDVASDTEAETIPSLILQPVVENALKHGLAPKMGPGLLFISAQLQGDRVCLRVEDDGIGLRGTEGQVRLSSNAGYGNRNSTGVGLRNVAQRLQTLYQDRARLDLEPRIAGGTRVTLFVPRSGVLES